MSDLKYYLALLQLPNFGPMKFKRALETYDDIKDVWSAGLPELLALGFNAAEATAVLEARSKINPDDELKKAEDEGLGMIAIKDSEYPPLLKEIPQPPPVIFYRGNISGLYNDCLAVVGSRKFTAYGKAAAEKIVTPLAASGLTIVSGLAMGIDALAHEAALAGGGLTAAVLGSDLDWKNIGPKSNWQTAQKILDSGGCILSEYPLGTAASKGTFPQRNRIISGLSRGTLVIEAGESSGSLITANFALEQNREVFAVPGSIYSAASAGTNNLIKKGAKAVTESEDILTELCWQTNLKTAEKAKPNELGIEEALIVKHLDIEPLTLDKLAELTNIRVNVLMEKVTLLEIIGQIKRIDGGKFLKI